MIRGMEPIVGKNPFAKEGTPKADFKITRAGLFTILKTKVSCWYITKKKVTCEKNCFILCRFNSEKVTCQQYQIRSGQCLQVARLKFVCECER